MLSHISIGVLDLRQSIQFYDAILAALGYSRIWSTSDAAGYGIPGETEEPFALKQEKSAPHLGSSPRSHIAFAAKNQQSVIEFHAAAIRSGGKDQGQPGSRPQYGEHYFAAVSKRSLSEKKSSTQFPEEIVTGNVND